MDIQLSEQQEAAKAALTAWARDPQRKPVFRLFGYAGTGKTTITKHLVDKIGLSARYAAYTGKAASVMRAKGMTSAETLHSLAYVFDGNDRDGRPMFKWAGELSVLHSTSLLVIDECSMVGEDLASDILRYNVPLIVIGDPAQLPPVAGTGVFVNKEPDVMLTEIHRQAAGNPIISLATTVRTGGALSFGTYGESSVVRKRDISDDELFSADQILVGTNAKREFYNRRMRKHFGIDEPYPQFGEKLICIRNNRELGIYNGEMFMVASCEDTGGKYLTMSLARLEGGDDILESIKVHKGNFNPKYLDDDGKIPMFEDRNCASLVFGYAVTVHKAQGSQWDNVVLMDESWVFRDSAQRWMYTGITRAAKSIKIVKG